MIGIWQKRRLVLIGQWQYQCHILVGQWQLILHSNWSLVIKLHYNWSLTNIASFILLHSYWTMTVNVLFWIVQWQINASFWLANDNQWFILISQWQSMIHLTWPMTSNTSFWLVHDNVRFILIGPWPWPSILDSDWLMTNQCLIPIGQRQSILYSDWFMTTYAALWLVHDNARCILIGPFQPTNQTAGSGCAGGSWRPSRGSSSSSPCPSRSVSASR